MSRSICTGWWLVCVCIDEWLCSRPVDNAERSINNERGNQCVVTDEWGKIGTFGECCELARLLFRKWRVRSSVFLGVFFFTLVKYI